VRDRGGFFFFFFLGRKRFSQALPPSPPITTKKRLTGWYHRPTRCPGPPQNSPRTNQAKATRPGRVINQIKRRTGWDEPSALERAKITRLRASCFHLKDFMPVPPVEYAKTLKLPPLWPGKENQSESRIGTFAASIPPGDVSPPLCALAPRPRQIPSLSCKSGRERQRKHPDSGET